MSWEVTLVSTWNCPFSACWLSCRRWGRHCPGSWLLSHAARFLDPNHLRRSSAGWADGADPVCFPSTVLHRCKSCRSGCDPWCQTPGWFHPFWLRVLFAARLAVFLKAQSVDQNIFFYNFTILSVFRLSRENQMRNSQTFCLLRWWETTEWNEESPGSRIWVLQRWSD